MEGVIEVSRSPMVSLCYAIFNFFPTKNNLLDEIRDKSLATKLYPINKLFLRGN